MHGSKQRRTVLTNPHTRNTVGRSNLDDELDGVLGVVAAIARDNDGAAGELPCVQRPKHRLHVVHTNKGSTSAYWCRARPATLDARSRSSRCSFPPATPPSSCGAPTCRASGPRSAVSRAVSHLMQRPSLRRYGVSPLRSTACLPRGRAHSRMTPWQQRNVEHDRHACKTGPTVACTQVGIPTQTGVGLCTAQ